MSARYPWLDEVLPVADEAHNALLILDLSISRAVALANLGRKVEAAIVLTGALDVATRLGIDDMRNRAAVNLGYTLAFDDPYRSFEISRDALEEEKRAGVIWGTRYIAGNAIDSAIEVGEWDWAAKTIAELEPIMTEPAERLWFGIYDIVPRLNRVRYPGDGADPPRGFIGI